MLKGVAGADVSADVTCIDIHTYIPYLNVYGALHLGAHVFQLCALCSASLLPPPSDAANQVPLGCTVGLFSGGKYSGLCLQYSVISTVIRPDDATGLG